MFSKFKNILKIFKGKFSGFLLIIFIGILFKITIFSPCLVYGFNFCGGEITFKDLKSLQVRTNIVRPQILSDVGRVARTGVDVVFQKVELMNKGMLKFGSCFIEILSPVSAYGEEIAKQKTDKEGDYPDSRMRKYIDKQIVQCFFAFILVLSGYIICGLILLTVIRKIYYIYT